MCVDLGKHGFHATVVEGTVQQNEMWLTQQGTLRVAIEHDVLERVQDLHCALAFLTHGVGTGVCEKDSIE
jgi:hypothetical protein